jgi:hypothetical protein
MHPLAPDLSKLTDDELHKKHAELVSRMTFAYRMGHGEMVGQMQLLAQDYAVEVEKRNQKMLSDANKNGRNLQGKIDITK